MNPLPQRLVPTAETAEQPRSPVQKPDEVSATVAVGILFGIRPRGVWSIGTHWLLRGNHSNGSTSLRAGTLEIGLGAHGSPCAATAGGDAAAALGSVLTPAFATPLETVFASIEPWDVPPLARSTVAVFVIAAIPALFVFYSERMDR